MRISGDALTFDDVLLLPAYSNLLPREADLQTRLTREVALSIPLISAAMDTVTEARLAIAMAQAGGIGVVHKNLTAEAQAAEVDAVKSFESGVIQNPITVTPEVTIREVIDLTRAKKHLRGAGRFRRSAVGHRHESRSAFRKPVLIIPSARL